MTKNQILAQDNSSEELSSANKKTQKEIMKDWFLSNYKDPSECLPYESREGGYIYIWGGPYDASEELYRKFAGIISEQSIDELVEELEEVTLEWSGNPDSQEDINVKGLIDESYFDDSIPIINYDISSYGADLDVKDLVERLDHGDIIVPKFQRNYVWNKKMAEQFIESLLLELPVPGIFLFQDIDSKKLLVIDGQQRLKTLFYFCNGLFPSKSNIEANESFSLINVLPQFENLTYETLNDSYRRILNNSIIHTTIIKQNTSQEPSAIIHIYERINNRGIAFSNQEMRNAVYGGKFIDLITDLNTNTSWRKVFGHEDLRLRDQELIIRFLALFFEADIYKPPLSEFLNSFVAKYREPEQAFIEECKNIFVNAINIAYKAVGKDVFKIRKALYTTIFDSVMVGIAKRLKESSTIDYKRFQLVYDELIANSEYIEAIKAPTSNRNVLKRLKIAIEVFSRL